MEIIGRILEQAELEAAFASNEAELIAVYGRRRVGKTFLIKNFFQSKPCIYFQITGIYKGSLKKQLTEFAKQLGATFYRGASIKRAANWLEMFHELTRALTEAPPDQKIVLFFDEFPWLAARKSGVISALEYFWNQLWSDDNRIKLIVCGSSASWIIHKIIKNRGGLHNRITRKIKLLPFNLADTFSYLQHLHYSCDQLQTLKLYMVTGGVPFYLKNIKKNYSVDQNINHLFFNSNGPFFDEFDEVFSSLFDHSEQYKELITIITQYKDGISRKLLNKKNKLTGAGGRLTKRLEDLEYAGFITSYIPWGHKKYGIFYRISDDYCYFYLKWIEPIKTQLKKETATNFWKRIIATPEYYGWLGYSFENICYKHILQIKKALGIEEYSLAFPWRYIPKKNVPEDGVQIDLVMDRDDNAITLCEIKYSEKPFIIDKQLRNELQSKIDIFKKKTKTKKQIFFAMILSDGLKKTSHSETLIHSIVTLEDLFK